MYSKVNHEPYLIQEIEKLTPAKIIGFRLWTDKLLYDTYTSKFWCAGYIMNGCCSDDGFEYLRNWVISRGINVYYNAKENPDTVISEATKRTNSYRFECFWYVGLEEFNSKTGKSLYDCIDNDKFTTTEVNYPEIEFK